MEEGYEGAEILGIHFEGPYLNKAHKGAQPEEYCVKPNIEQFKRYQKAAHGLIKYITMAVENDEDYTLTKYCSQNNVVVSIGHSNATYEQAVQAYAHGARSMTHVYNAMTPFTHRANGLVGGALRIRNMYGEIICDGNHSTLAALNNFFTSKGPDYSIMITDSLMCKGFPVGTKFDFGGQEVVIYPDGSAHLVEAGNLAGSTLNVNKGLKILIEDLFEVSKATSKTVTLNIMDVDIVSLMRQVKLELQDKIDATDLLFRWQLPEEKVILPLDSQRTYRVFENLIVNITKYAMPRTRVYITMENTENHVKIIMKNISATELNFNPNEITERFVRGDASRNTEGSGLGLAIAKSFTELQGGRLDISTDADLFTAEITFLKQ